MNIISIEILNNKAIKCFNVKPCGKNVEVAGHTGTGKTTAISALWSILSKGKDTLTHGENNGSIKVEIGIGGEVKYIAERKITPKTSTITVVKMIGNNPMPVDTKDFEKMISSLSMNPHKIVNLKPTERIKALLQAAECDIDLEDLDKQIEDAEAERLFAGRAAAGIKPSAIYPKADPVSITDLIVKRDALVAANKKITDLSATLNELIRDQDEDSKELERLKAAIAERAVRIEKGQAWIISNPLKHTDLIDGQIASAEATNKAASLYEQQCKMIVEFEKLQAARDKADERVKELRESKKASLERAKWPLEGITIYDGDILYNGIRFDNLGESEQMLVTSAIALGDIERHDIKVVRLDGVESMSKSDYEKLKKLFNGRDVQILSTRVSRGDLDCGEITITEGKYEECDSDEI
jgi:hypothetical protein